MYSSLKRYYVETYTKHKEIIFISPKFFTNGTGCQKSPLGTLRLFRNCNVSNT